MKKNGLVVFLVSVWIILSVIFGIYDLDISKQIVNQNSGWAKFLQDYGMIPGIFVLLSGIYIYYSFIKSKVRCLVIHSKSSILFSQQRIDISSGRDNHLDNFATNNFLVFLIISFAISLLVIIAHSLQKSGSKYY
jgi:hypothetical protein